MADNGRVVAGPNLPEKPPEELRLGEYFLHVFVEDTTSLDIPSEKDAEICAKVDAFGQENYSKSLKNITRDTAAYFSEHFFFVKIFDRREALENETLDVSIVSKGTFSNTLIGTVSFNISAIYFEPKRTIYHKWFILQNKNEDFQKVKGYVKLSVNLSSDKDEKVELIPETFDDKAKGISDNIEIPPSVTIKTSQLKIDVLRAENFPKLDNFGAGIDAFLEFSLGTMQLRTKTIPSLNPVWNESIFMPIPVPSFVNVIKMEALDYDAMSRNDKVGSTSFEIPQIRKGQWKSPTWVHLYGAPEGSDSDQVNIMHDFPSRGSQNR